MGFLQERIKKHFTDNIEVKALARDILPEKIVFAGELLVKCLEGGNNILSCGNGGSACDAQHFACELLNRLQIERRPLAAIALNTDASTLTAIANDYSYDEVFSKQVMALGAHDDVLLAISTSGNSKNVIAAIHAAHAKGLKVVALTGGNGGVVSTILKKDDIELVVPSDIVIRIQETHILIIHSLCDLIDYQLFIHKTEK